jgi:hypothetical protein
LRPLFDRIWSGAGSGSGDGQALAAFEPDVLRLSLREIALRS